MLLVRTVLGKREGIAQRACVGEKCTGKHMKIGAPPALPDFDRSTLSFGKRKRGCCGRIYARAVFRQLVVRRNKRAEQRKRAARVKWFAYRMQGGEAQTMDLEKSVQQRDPSEQTSTSEARNTDRRRSRIAELNSVFALLVSVLALTLGAYQARLMNEQTRLMQGQA